MMGQSTFKFLKFALHKRYFDTGLGVTNYLKYPLVLLGIAIPNPKAIIAVAGLYACFCYGLGWWWLNRGMAEAETEVSNRYNPFVKEMRKLIGKENKRKIYK
jgi:hypothetical protein